MSIDNSPRFRIPLTEHVQLTGFTALLAGIIHIAYTATIAQLPSVGPDGFFPTGTLAFRIDMLVMAFIIGLYLLGLTELHLRERTSYGRLGQVLAFTTGAAFAAEMLVWATMAATATMTFAGIEDALLLAANLTFFVSGTTLLAYAVVLWHRTNVTRIGITAIAASMPVVLLGLAIEPTLGAWIWISILLFAGGWIAIGLNLRAHPVSEPVSIATE